LKEMQHEERRKRKLANSRRNSQLSHAELLLEEVPEK